MDDLPRAHNTNKHQFSQHYSIHSPSLMACVADREAAVREVAQVYELIKLQQPLLLLHSPPPSTTQLAQSLLGKALRALNVALSVMKQQPPPPPVVAVTVKAEPHHQLSPHSPASADSEVAPSTATRGAKRRRSSVAMEGKKKTSSSWAQVTAVPYDDGYEWRKYGEKKINGTLFTRSYFRCTYKDDDVGCLATKHVQQMDNSSDQPMFHVTYNNHHTCNRAKASAIAKNGSSSSNNLAALLADCSNGSSSGKRLTTTMTTAISARPTELAAAAAAMNMKQEEPPLLLPALIDLQPSACFPHEQIPQCQQEPLFPTSMEQQFVCGALRDDQYDSPVDGEIPSASTGSCISGETSWWDGYSGDMAAQMAAEDDPLHDLDRFLQCDSFFMD